jgi:hypothetical protein
MFDVPKYIVNNKQLRYRSIKYVLLEDELYYRTIDRVLLKCLGEEEP